ncbi:hypothetical protein ACHAPY_006133 [Fusarium culmorum]
MNSSVFSYHAEELDAISSSFHAIFDRLLQTTQNVSKGPVLRLAGPEDIPRLREISTPGTAHPVQDAIEDVFTISDFRFRMNHPRTFAFIPAPVSPLSDQSPSYYWHEEKPDTHHTNKRFSDGCDCAQKNTIKADRAANLKPFVIVGSCGTTNTGSIDPLEALAKVRDEEKIWLHIDGAFGASAVLGDTRSAVTKGLELADSISWDAHKWLFQTYSCSLILVRNKIDLARVYANDGDYLRDALEHEEIPDFWNLGMELTRPCRALKLWFTLRVLGVERIGKMVDHGFDIAEIAEAEVGKLPDWEIISPASMAIVTFRYAPVGKTNEELDALNAAISKHILDNNIAGLLTTKVRGRVVLRICSISPILTKEELVDIVVQVGQVAKLV